MTDVKQDVVNDHHLIWAELSPGDMLMQIRQFGLKYKKNSPRLLVVQVLSSVKMPFYTPVTTVMLMHPGHGVLKIERFSLDYVCDDYDIYVLKKVTTWRKIKLASRFVYLLSKLSVRFGLSLVKKSIFKIEDVYFKELPPDDPMWCEWSSSGSYKCGCKYHDEASIERFIPRQL
jgi:hypothetical protein